MSRYSESDTKFYAIIYLTDTHYNASTLFTTLNKNIAGNC